MNVHKFAFLAPLALLAGCADIPVSGQTFYNEDGVVQITHKIDGAYSTNLSMPVLEAQKKEWLQTFSEKGFTISESKVSRSFFCLVAVRYYSDSAERNVTCHKNKSGQTYKVSFKDDASLGTMFTFFFPDNLKKPVPKS